jgi:hypothetical protein
MLALWIIERCAAQHCAGDGEQSIADGAQSTIVGLAALAQGVVAFANGWIELGCGARPMIEGIAQAVLAGEAPDNEGMLAASAGDGSDAAERAQGIVVSGFERLGGLGEQRGEDDPSDPWQGKQDRRVTRLVRLPQCVVPGVGELAGQGVELDLCLAELTIDECDAADEAADMGAGGLGGAWGDDEGGLAQQAQCLVGIEAANVVIFEQSG